MTKFIEQQQREVRDTASALLWGESSITSEMALIVLTKQTITNTLNHILESGLLEEQDAGEAPGDSAAGSEQRIFGANGVKEAIREFITNMK